MSLKEDKINRFQINGKSNLRDLKLIQELESQPAANQSTFLISQLPVMEASTKNKWLSSTPLLPKRSKSNATEFKSMNSFLPICSRNISLTPSIPSFPNSQWKHVRFWKTSTSLFVRMLVTIQTLFQSPLVVWTLWFVLVRPEQNLSWEQSWPERIPSISSSWFKKVFLRPATLKWEWIGEDLKEVASVAECSRLCKEWIMEEKGMYQEVEVEKARRGSKIQIMSVCCPSLSRPRFM